MVTETERRPAVHDQVLVEADVDGKVVGLRAVIVNVLPTSMWLGLACPDASLEQLHADQAVNLTFKRRGAALVAESHFLTHLGASRTRLFSVEWPDDLRLTQRREHLRLDAECPIEYTVISQSDAGCAGRMGRGSTLNISAGGLRFVVRVAEEDVVGRGDELELNVGLGSDAVSTEAEVIRVEFAARQAASSETIAEPQQAAPGLTGIAGPATLVAVRFVSISELGQDMIVRYIFSQQRLRKDVAEKTA
jgi:c-di-GMP-binding flagellar brake protein YcgR